MHQGRMHRAAKPSKSVNLHGHNPGTVTRPWTRQAANVGVTKNMTCPCKINKQINTATQKKKKKKINDWKVPVKALSFLKTKINIKIIP